MTIEREKLLILGTSLLGPEVLDLINDIGKYEIIAFVENFDKDKVGIQVRGFPVIWIDDAVKYAETHYCICALGTTHRHSYVKQAKRLGFRFVKIIHPTACISGTSSVGEGAIVSAGVIVASHTSIGDHVFINRGSLIGHNTVIDDYVTVSPGSNIAGVVSIGTCSYIGMGSIVLDRMKIGRNAVVGAGSVVTREVPDRTLVMGIPAKIVKTDIEGR